MPVVPQLWHVLQDGLDGPGRSLSPAAGVFIIGSSVPIAAAAALLQAEQVEDLVRCHGLETGVVRGDDGVGRLQLELLEPQDLLLNSVAGDQAVHVHNLGGKKKEREKKKER